MAGTRHPRFGPAERDRGPIVAPRVVEAGARPCPRCHDGITAGDIYCRSCGLDVSLLPPLPRHRNSGVWTTPGPQGTDVYKPLQAFTRVLQGLVIVSAALGLVLAVVSVLLWRKLGGGALPNLEVSTTSWSWSQLHGWAVSLAKAQIAVFAAASILTIAWTSRAYRNLSGLDVQAKRPNPLWASFGWVVPGLNLFVPKIIVDTTWRASDPRVAGDRESGHQTIPTSSHLWWICTLVSIPTLTLAMLELSDLTPIPPTALAAVHADRGALVLLAVAELLLVFTAALYVRTLGSVAERQKRRAECLGPPAALIELRGQAEPIVDEPIDLDLVAANRADEDPWAFALEPWPDGDNLEPLSTIDTRVGRY